MKAFTLSTITFFLLFCNFNFAQQARQQYLQEQLSDEKNKIQQQEREQLKARIRALNNALEKREISERQADSLKLNYAEETALKIEERELSIETKLYGNEFELKEKDEAEEVTNTFYYTQKRRESRSYFSNDLVLAVGLNNLLEENSNIENSPYEFIKSYFIELGWSWKTNLIPNSSFLNLRYGFSFQFNTLYPEDKGIFTSVAGEVQRIPYSKPLIRNRLAFTNLVFPIHFEFNSNQKQFTSYSANGSYVKQHYNRNSIIFGAGAYGGFHIHNIQRIKGEDFKEKVKNNLDFNDLIYGISGYIYFPKAFTIYAKTDLSPLFKNQTGLQNNISLGIRFDID